MNIGLVLGSTFVGGMERQAAYLSEGFIDKGHKVYVYVASYNISLKFRSKVKFPKNVIYHLWDTKFTKKLSRSLLNLYNNKHKIDVFIAFQVGSIELCNHIKSIYISPKVIGNIRGINFASNLNLKKRYQLACSHTNGLICNSMAGLHLINKHLVSQNSIPLSMIPNIVRLPNKFSKKENNEYCILFAGSLKTVKDPLTFLRAVVSSIKKNPRITSIIAGEGPLKEKMVSFVKKQKLQSKIKFLGSLKPEKVPYEQAHLVISSSIREASSNTILEALAHGICVIGTNVGGTTELLNNKSFGSLFQPGDTKALELAIFKFSNLSPEELNRRGKEAHEFIKMNFDEENIIDKYLKFINLVING